MSLLPPPPKTSLESPTNVRYGVLALSVAMSVLFYLHRFALSSIGPTIIGEFHTDKATFGWAGFWFFYVYALCQIPAGLMADRVGGRIVLSICVLGWSLVLALIGLAQSIWGIALGMAMLGVFQAAAYPTVAGYLKHWMPLATRGIANGSVTMGGRAGAMLATLGTPLLVAYALYFSGWAEGGWRIVFGFYAALGLIWTLLFWSFFRDRPSQHPSCNEAEVVLIADGKVPSEEAPPAIPWLKLLTSRNLWLISGVNFFSNIAWIFLAYWLNTYFESVYGVPKDQVGFYGALITLFGVLGNIAGGFATDRCVQQFGQPWGRKITAFIGPGIAIVLYVFCYFGGGLYTMVALFAAIWFFLDFELSARWGVCQDFGGQYVATIVGFANMCGNLGAAVFIPIIGKLGDAQKWEYLFAIACVALVCDVLCWVFIDPRVPVVEEDSNK